MNEGEIMWKELLIYNPILWIVYFYLFFFVWGWLKANVELKGSWKQLDKSIHWKNKSK